MGLSTLSSGSLISNWLILNQVISDLFNYGNGKETCQPACKTVEEGEYDLIEKCRIIVGYDDLLHKFGHNTVTTQKGRFWDFTCSRNMTGYADANGAVNGTTEKVKKETKTVETDFSLDLTCCDPDDANCKEVSLYLCLSLI